MIQFPKSMGLKDSKICSTISFSEIALGGALDGYLLSLKLFAIPSVV
jgi:hypothetical protein